MNALSANVDLWPYTLHNNWCVFEYKFQSKSNENYIFILVFFFLCFGAVLLLQCRLNAYSVTKVYGLADSFVSNHFGLAMPIVFKCTHKVAHRERERERDMEKEQITRWNNRYSAEDKNHRKPIPASAQHAHYYITTITVPTLKRMCVGWLAGWLKTTYAFEMQWMQGGKEEQTLYDGIRISIV